MSTHVISSISKSGLDTNITLVDERWHKVTISLQRCVLAVGLDGQDTHQSTLSHGCGSTLTFNEILIDAGELLSRRLFSRTYNNWVLYTHPLT